jgi:hypothetical protein
MAIQQVFLMFKSNLQTQIIPLSRLTQNKFMNFNSEFEVIPRRQESEFYTSFNQKN